MRKNAENISARGGEQNDNKTEWDNLTSKKTEKSLGVPETSQLPRQLAEDSPDQKITHGDGATRAEQSDAHERSRSRMDYAKVGRKILHSQAKLDLLDTPGIEEMTETPEYRELSAYYEQLTNEQTVNPEDFTDVYSQHVIDSDVRFVKRLDKKFILRDIMEDQVDFEQLLAARRLEKVIVEGINDKNWLGGEVNFRRGGGTSAFQATAELASRYDDIIHKVDAFVTIDQPSLRAKDKAGKIQGANRVVFGLDATVSSSPAAMTRKIMVSHHDRLLALPYGFTKVKYYQHGDEKHAITGVPRYVVGVASEDIEGEDDDRQNHLNRFKILSEMYAESKLYQSLQPPDTAGTPWAKMFFNLSMLGGLARRALRRAGMEIIAHDYLPKQLNSELVKLGRKKKFDIIQNKITQYLINESDARFHEQHPDKPQHTDIFVEIMTTCQKLSDQVQNGEIPIRHVPPSLVREQYKRSKKD